MNKYHKMNRQERRSITRERVAQNLIGEGLYVFQNNTKGDLQLPKPPSKGGIRIGNITLIPLGAKFEGDSYFMGMVRTNELRLVETLVSPEQRNNMQEKKLILDQPDKVTSEGKVEHVLLSPKPEKLNEGQPNGQQTEALINEDPMDGVQILN